MEFAVTIAGQAANAVSVTPLVLPCFYCLYRAACYRAACYRAACYRAACYRAACYRAACYRAACYRAATVRERFPPPTPC